jgi:serine/threonine-protein kinase
MSAANRVPPLSSGDTLARGQYTIERLLGGGGFGYVYLARDRQGQHFAIKQCTELDADFVMQFGHELAVLKMLAPNSTYFPRVYAEFTEALPGALPNSPKYSFAVMEFVAGQTLEDLLDERLNRQQGPFPEAEATAWIVQLLEALDYAHQRGIIHRDVKPANIMLQPDGKHIKIIDVGIAKIGGSGTKTQRGAAAYSPGFTPPEQYAQAGQTDRISDIYAAGATLYALLTGVIPVEAPSRISGMQTLTPPRQLNPALSARVEDVILRAMEMDVTRRYQRAGDMLAALQGKAVTAPIPCPNCGATNQTAARFCLKCGAPLQAPSPQAPSLTLAGMQVQRRDDLIQACERGWADVVGQLMVGRIDQWLQGQGATGQAWLAALHAARSQHPRDPNLQLDAFLRQVAPQRTPAQLRIQPAQLPVISVEQGASAALTFEVINTGQGYLTATLACTEPWLSVQPAAWSGPGGSVQQVQVIVDASQLVGSRSGKPYAAPLQLKSNGGDTALLCTASVTAAPRLNVQPLQVDFGAVAFGQTTARTIQVANDGIGVLSAGIRASDTWLQTPTSTINVPGRGRESLTIQVNPRELNVRGRHTGELIVDAGAEGGATVQITVTVDGPFYPSVEPAPLDNVLALIAWCDKHWQHGTQLLRRGELHAAARYLGEPARGVWSRRSAEPWAAVLSKVQQAASERDANIGLEQALRALGAAPPTFVTNWREVERQLGLGLLPDLRWMTPWWQGPAQVVLRIKNTGRGYLYGQVTALARWLAVDAPQFGCFAGQEAAIPIRIARKQRKLSGLAPELLEVQIE